MGTVVSCSMADDNDLGCDLDVEKGMVIEYLGIIAYLFFKMYKIEPPFC